MSAPTTTKPRPARPASRAVPAIGSGVTIDPIRIVRQHLVLLFVTGVVGLVIGTGVFIVWLRYFPSYSGVATFELIGTLDDAADAKASEERNEETVQRIAGT